MLRGNKYRETTPSPIDVSCDCCNLSTFAQKSAREIFGEKGDNGVEHKDYKDKWRKRELKRVVCHGIFPCVYGSYSVAV